MKQIILFNGFFDKSIEFNIFIMETVIFRLCAIPCVKSLKLKIILIGQND